MNSFPTHQRMVRGFTLVELIVSLGIFTILTTMIVANYPETATRLTLANTNQNISLLVREAQVRGSAIDSVNSSRGGYGIYVTRAASSTVILFGDSVDVNVPKPYGITIGNGLFESSPINETDTIVKLPTRYFISKLCVGTGYPFSCNTAHAPDITTLTVTYIRPNPMPVIYINDTKTSDYQAACIEIRSPRAPLIGHVSTVQVFNSGMILETAGTCDGVL